LTQLGAGVGIASKDKKGIFLTDGVSDKNIAEMDFSKYRNDSNPNIKINTGLAESIGKRK
jgi:hypothetical protein